MYFSKAFFDEYNHPTEVELICNKCGKYISIKDVSQFSNVKPDYCIVKPDSKIVCSECGNISNSRLVEYKKNVRLNDCIVKQPLQVSNSPKCPTCGSINIKPISGAERTVSVIGLGILSKKINKSYKCLNCKYTW